ncbi:MAG: cytidylate kinase-like family protein [Bacteroidales bacterium]
MQRNFILNIGRQLGSGGRQIGLLLSKQLNFNFYDKEIINVASKESGLSEECFEKVDEKRNDYISGLLGLRLSFMSGASFNGLSNDSLFQIQSEAMCKLADHGSCIFVGRCADYILRDRKECFNIFINAPLEIRTKHIAEKHNISIKEAQILIEKTDKSRADYYNFYTDKNWGDSTSYHLCIDSSFLGIPATALLIEDILQRKTT